MSTEHAWSPGQRALLRFLEREGLVSALPPPPADDGTPSDERLFSLIAELVDPSVVAEAMAARLRLPLLAWADDVDPAAAALVAAPVAVRCGAAPVALQGHTLEVAMANPLDLDMVKTIEFASGRRVRVRVATPDTVRHALTRLYGDEAVSLPTTPPVGEVAAAARRPDDIAASEPCEMPSALEPAVGPPVESADATPAAPFGPRLVVIVGDAGARQALADALRAADDAWIVMTAGDEDEAALLLAVTGIDLLVTDAPLPPLGLVSSHPAMPVLVVSGVDPDVAGRARAVLDSLGAR